MEPCRRVGVDCTYRCNWRCQQCFYRFEGILKDGDPPWEVIKDKIDVGREGGCDHVVMVGYGEPSLSVHVDTIITYAKECGMSSSMITNGSTGLKRYQRFYDEGIDHLHISSQGLKGTLEKVCERPGMWERQHELKTWLCDNQLPWRNNVSLQQFNYKELPDIARYECDMGITHFVVLGFLPHYGLQYHVGEIAVHPAVLRPYIEEAADIVLANGRYLTIRYHPMCHLREDLWKYVVNAKYVVYDNMEWNYTLQTHDEERIKIESANCMKSAAIQGNPCSVCDAQRHCGGWNYRMRDAFDGAGLKAIHETPDEYADVWCVEGGLHDMNPATRLPSVLKDI